MEMHQKIFDLIDGNLLEAEQIELFRQLAENDELRKVFNEANLLKETLVENKELFVPPVMAKSNIFSALNLDMPPTTIPVKPKFYQGKFFLGSISSLITAIALVGLYYAMDNMGDEAISVTQNYSNYQVPQFEIVVPSSEQKANSLMQSKAVSNNSVSFNNQRNIHKVEMNDKDIENETRDNTTQFEIVMADKVDVTTFENNFNAGSYYANYPNNLGRDFNWAVNNSNFAVYNQNEFNGFELEWNGNLNYNLPEETIQPNKYQQFNNNSLGIFYSLSDNIALGVEVRNENFFQVYEDAYKIYEQTPNFTSVSFATNYKVYSNFVFDGLDPYLRLQLGVNRGGWLYRTAFGLKYELIEGVFFNSNIEYSGLNFTHEGNPFISNKLSLNYGISFKF